MSLDLHAGAGGAVPSSTPVVGLRPYISWRDGGRVWLLLKEGVHILLDRILLKDGTHLGGKCPLYARLSRTEKRAAVLQYAVSLILKHTIYRTIIVDTISVAILEACEAEALLEAPLPGLPAGCADEEDDPDMARAPRPRMPFMQKVLGDALAELLGPEASARDQRLIGVLIAQSATEREVMDGADRFRELWLSSQVAGFFDSLAEHEKPPALIFCGSIYELFGLNYFLPPPPSFSSAEEKTLADAIRRDENDAGKETVFAANLKKALKLIRQARKTSKGGSSFAAGRAQTAAAAACVASAAAVMGLGDVAMSSTGAGTADVMSALSEGAGTDAAAAAMPADAAPATPPDWWLDQSWISRYCAMPLNEVAQALRADPGAWFKHWSTLGKAGQAEVLSLTAAETCDVIDHQPLWLSLRGMVGCNLYRDGVWPIISNDGRLTLLHFCRDDKERFWYVPQGGALTAMFPMFMAWARTTAATLRSELLSLGRSLTEKMADDVARGVQAHLEHAIAAFILFKVVSRCLESRAAAMAHALGARLIEEEAETSSKPSQGGSKSRKAKQRARQKAKRKAEQAAAKAKAEQAEEAERAARAAEEARAQAARAAAEQRRHDEEVAKQAEIQRQALREQQAKQAAAKAKQQAAERAKQEAAAANAAAAAAAEEEASRNAAAAAAGRAPAASQAKPAASTKLAAKSRKAKLQASAPARAPVEPAAAPSPASAEPAAPSFSGAFVPSAASRSMDDSMLQVPSFAASMSMHVSSSAGMAPIAAPMGAGMMHESGMAHGGWPGAGTAAPRAPMAPSSHAMPAPTSMHMPVVWDQPLMEHSMPAEPFMSGTPPSSHMLDPPGQSHVFDDMGWLPEPAVATSPATASHPWPDSMQPQLGLDADDMGSFHMASDLGHLGSSPGVSGLHLHSEPDLAGLDDDSMVPSLGLP